MRLNCQTFAKSLVSPLPVCSSIFETFNLLAQRTNSINLGAGTPSGNPPPFVSRALQRHRLSGRTVTFPEKSSSFGEQSYTLNRKISSIYSPKFNIPLHPRRNIIINEGARESLNACISTFLSEGDEAIIFDPSYEIYRQSIRKVGAIPVAVPIAPRKFISKAEIKKRGFPLKSTADDEWDIDFSSLRESINSRTKVIVLNSPHNPTGKIFSEAELQQICKILKEYPKIVVLDDRVYEHTHFDAYQNREVPKISDIKGMWNKTITIYSGGKLLKYNGLKCGWMVGPSKLIEAINKTDRPKPLDLQTQLIVSDSLQFIYSKNQNYLSSFTQELSERRELLLKSLIDSKYDFNLWVPQAGYFVMANISNIQFQNNSTMPRDFAFCVKMCEEDRVASIPCSSFFDKESKMGQSFIRFAFCKDSEQIQEAAKRMQNCRSSIY